MPRDHDVRPRMPDPLGAAGALVAMATVATLVGAAALVLALTL